MVSNTVSPIRKRWALLVGINHYTEPQCPDLNFCVNDVQALAALLAQVGYSVICLHDEQDPRSHHFPTRNNILAALTLFCATHPDDLLLVYFSCHGIQIEHTPYLVAQDTRAATVDLFQQQAIALSEIETLLRGSSATRKILMLDACHTGIEMGRDIADPDFIRNVCEQAQGFALLAASTAQQQAFELAKMQHGVFSYFVLKGLSGEADERSRQLVTFDDLKGYVLNGIRDWNKTAGGLVQEPTYKSEGIGDMILVDYREQAKPSLNWNEADRQDIDSPSEGRISNEPVTLSRADQAMIESLQKQRQGHEKQLAAVTEELLGANADDEVRLEFKRANLVKKIRKIDQQLQELGNVM